MEETFREHSTPEVEHERKRRRIEGTHIRGHDWADGLPRDLLDNVLDKLPLFADFVRFGAVCHSWRSATHCVFNQKRRLEYQLSSSHHHKIPLLLFPLPPPVEENKLSLEEEEEDQTNKYWERSLYSVVERKMVCKDFKFEAPNGHKRICGSSHGWLITANKTTPGNDALTLTLINPFYIGGGGSGRCSQGIIHLPPFDPHPGTPLYMSDLGIQKVVLSAPPDDDDFMVVVLFGIAGLLAFLGPGHKSWTYPHKPKHHNLLSLSCSDVVYHDRQLYMATEDGGLAVCNPATAKPCLRKIVPPPHHCNPHWDWIKRYIVISPPPTACDDDAANLLLVYRYVRHNIVRSENDDFRDYKLDVHTHSVFVFKLLKIGSLRSWVRMKSIGDRVLFLGENYSTCILASDFPLGTLQPNSIYFTENTTYQDGGGICFTSSSDMGVFNLGDHSFTPFSQPFPSLAIPAPVWFIPSIPSKWC